MSPPSRRHDAAQPWDERSVWDTWRVKARVLGVARNLTSATRLRDVLSLLRRPDGIEIWYTVNPGSRFTDGLAAYLTSLEPEERVLTWAEALEKDSEGHFDLAVSCAVNASMRALRAPLVVMPHGAGYNRLVRESTGDSVSPAGLSRRELTYEGSVIPRIIWLSHEEQLPRLARACPEAVPYAEVVGDLGFDRAAGSLASRDRYRRRLGVVDGRRLVVVNSTWSRHSLLGRHPGLPLRLVTSLPADEFRVALVMHPNVWARHGRQGVYDQLAEAMDAGLTVLPPQEGWRAALIAGDWIVGDHGSTTFYGAALGHATLLAADGLEELDPASPTAEFARNAPRLDPEGDVYGQLLRAAEEHAPEKLRPLTDATLGLRGESAEVQQRRLYGLLAARGVRPPSGPPRLPPVPEPEPQAHLGPQSFDVEGEVEEAGREAEDGAVRVRRFPLVAGHHRQARGFYAVTAEETHPLWPQSAAVLVRTVVESETPALQWLEEAAHGYPGLGVAVAALDEGCHLLRLRGGLLLEAHTQRGWGSARQRLDPVLLGAAVNLWLEEGAAPFPGRRVPERLAIRTGERSVTVRFAPMP